MSIIDNINSAQTSGTPNSKGALESFGSDQFLTLMLAQLRNQDPMKPLEPTEFIGQLAQFTTVSGIREMQDYMSSMVDSLRSSQALSGAQIVGREVLAAGSNARFDGLSALGGAVELPEDVREASVLIRDASGALVARGSLPAEAGMQSFGWDGTRSDGTMSPPGSYQFEVIANVGGRNQSMEVMLRSRVNSVTLDANGRGLTLNTPNGSLLLSDVRQVM